MSQDRESAALEEQVAELAATVDGLTNELVDAKERIRELEVELGIREGEPAEDYDESMTVEELFEASEADPIAADEEAGSDGEAADDESSGELGDDIIVG